MGVGVQSKFEFENANHTVVAFVALVDSGFREEIIMGRDNLNCV